MDSLSPRFEAATLEQLPGLLDELAIRCGHKETYARNISSPFFQLMAINTPESLSAAAMMLKPEGCRIYIGQIATDDWSISLTDDRQDEVHYKGRSIFAAAALGAAIAKSLGV